MPAHGLAVVFLPVVLDAEAAGGGGEQEHQGAGFSREKMPTEGYTRHLLTKRDCDVGGGQLIWN